MVLFWDGSAMIIGIIRADPFFTYFAGRADFRMGTVALYRVSRGPSKASLKIL